MIYCKNCGQTMMVTSVDELCSACKSEIEGQVNSMYPKRMKLNILYDDVDPIKVDEVNLNVKDLEKVIEHLSRLRDVHIYHATLKEEEDITDTMITIGELDELIKKLEVN